MKVEERFLKYIAIDTMSSETSNTFPTTKTQLEFGDVLVKDLKDIGVSDAKKDKDGYVYGHVNIGKEKTIGLIAHMDTAPALVGGIKKPQIVKNYDGKIIKLNDKYVLDPKKFLSLNEVVGDDLIVTDGEHLLGGDDKAGVAIIFAFAEYLINHKEEFNFNLAICFTPDEEVGLGASRFSVKEMKADVGFTLDGESCYRASYENFNAASCVVEITGVGVHPGSAKDIMVNAALLGVEYASKLPKDMIPGKTAGYDGFIHLCYFNGDVENAKLEYILRDHDVDLLEKKKEMMQKAADEIKKSYPSSTIKVTIKDSYKNMRYYFLKDPTAINIINKAYLASNMKLSYEPIRGGTDGATITYMGLPCPNLGTGDFNPHGRFEFVSINMMYKMIEMLKNMFKE